MSRELTLQERRQRYAEALDAALVDLVRQLEARPQVRRVVLFGSAARGQRDLFTDLDLLVVMESDQDFVTRTAALRQELRAPVDLDLLVYTPDELEHMTNRGFIRKILEEGQVLFAR